MYVARFVLHVERRKKEEEQKDEDGEKPKRGKEGRVQSAECSKAVRVSACGCVYSPLQQRTRIDGH